MTRLDYLKKQKDFDPTTTFYKLFKSYLLIKYNIIRIK